MNTQFVNTEKVKCPICMDFFEKSNITTTTCGHQFCCNCVDLWEEQNSSCPMCRTQMKKIKKKNNVVLINHNYDNKIMILMNSCLINKYN